ncbi:MAG: outer membrane lipoprotein-sorting protein [Vulcanimicrobiaceae bacterium]
MKLRSAFCAALIAGALVAAAPKLLDSQVVLQRYELVLAALPTPKAMIFSYSVSQAGPTNIEQRHLIYRSGMRVRDETIAVDGIPLSRKITRIYRRVDRYAVRRLAPRPGAYGFVFLRAGKVDGHLAYVYEAIPYVKSAVGFTVTRLIIDAKTYLPMRLDFTSVSGTALGNGEIDYAPFGAYWMPVFVSVNAHVDGRPARERISFEDYSFPPSLPDSTFRAPHPLPHPTLPAF